MRQRRLFAAAVLALGAAATGSGAQERLVGAKSWELGPLFEQWSFSKPIVQPRAGDSLPPTVKSASQFTIPFAVVLPIGDAWTIDAYGAYASGQVSLDTRDSLLTTDSYTLSGPTDLKLRATGRVRGDNVLLTFGVNVPTGTVSLDREQREALRVLGAPALQFRTPALGSGFGGTTGLILARQAGGWALALGTSYEVRGSYSPLTAQAFGLPLASAPDLNPSDALHLSVGADGLLGQHRMTVGVTTDLYGKDKLSVKSIAGTNSVTFQLGPTITASWQLLIASQRVKDLTLYAVDHIRSSFKGPTGNTVAGSNGMDAEFGLGGAMSMSSSLGFVFGLDGHYDSGLKVDQTIATAAMSDGAVTVGLAKMFGGLRVQPLVRARFGTIDSGGASTSTSGLMAALTFGGQF